MRPQRVFYCIPILATLAGCDSGLEMQPAIVQWMEWPAEVQAATPFAVRLLAPFPACHRFVFKPAVRAVDSVVTVEPYFLVEQGDPVCLPSPALDVAPLPFLALDTVITAPGLSARTFQMRATAIAVPPATNATGLRAFGDVTVRPSNPDTSRRNAGGIVRLWVDNAGCARILAAGYPQPPRGFVLEDQADTTGLNYAFVRGYIHETATPVCGETRVFHLVSIN